MFEEELEVKMDMRRQVEDESWVEVGVCFLLVKVDCLH